ncbi:MAG: hypothetical protein ACRDSR_01980 [Pseudonocardiaceae bacterium]
MVSGPQVTRYTEVRSPGEGCAAPRNPWTPRPWLFTPAEWEAFVLGAKDGEFDVM